MISWAIMMAEARNGFVNGWSGLLPDDWPHLVTAIAAVLVAAFVPYKIHANTARREMAKNRQRATNARTILLHELKAERNRLIVQFSHSQSFQGMLKRHESATPTQSDPDMRRNARIHLKNIPYLPPYLAELGEWTQLLDTKEVEHLSEWLHHQLRLQHLADGFLHELLDDVMVSTARILADGISDQIERTTTVIKVLDENGGLSESRNDYQAGKNNLDSH